MARTATMPIPRSDTLPLPQNTTHPAALAPPIPEGQTAETMPDWLLQQQQILRMAPDGDTAIRLLYAALLSERTMLLSENTRLTLALQAAQAPPAPVARTVRPSLRPAIRALLHASASPMTALQIEDALGSGGPLVKGLNDMVRDGQLTCTNGHYALAGATAVPPPAPPIPAPTPGRKGGRIVRPA